MQIRTAASFRLVGGLDTLRVTEMIIAADTEGHTVPRQGRTANRELALRHQCH